MSSSDPSHPTQAMDSADTKECPTTSWKADLQQKMDVLELNHVNRASKLKNKKPTPYERKMAAKKGTSTVFDITEFSNMITGNFPIVENFETPWAFAKELDQFLVKYKTVGLSMENKQVIIKEIDNIRAEFVKMFDGFMKSLGYCCGSVWGEKFISRWCPCDDSSPIIFVKKDQSSVFPNVFCEKCVGDARESCRETHRHDYVEMERFQCIKCRKELHRICAESFTANCCKQCVAKPFKYSTPLPAAAATTSPSPTLSSSNPVASGDIISNLIQKENCYVKILCEKKCPFLKADLMEGAIAHVKILREEQKLGTDQAMDEYLKSSSYTLKVFGLFYGHEEGDVLLALGFCEFYQERCLIEILALPNSLPNLKTAEIKKDIIPKFFIELVKFHRSSVKAVHVRVPAEVKGLSSEIFAEICVKLPKENIGIKTLKESLGNTVSFFDIPCFSNDAKFNDIVNIIHELGFKINNKLPKVRSRLPLKNAVKNFVGQLTNEIVIRGTTSPSALPSTTSTTSISTSTKPASKNVLPEVANDEKALSTIVSPNDLLQAMNEFHLKFSNLQSACYSTFKIVSFFFDPRSKGLPKAQSVDSGYSSLNSPSSSITSMNCRFSIDEKEVASIEKKHRPSNDLPLALKPCLKKRKLEHQIFTASSSTSGPSSKQFQNKMLLDSVSLPPSLISSSSSHDRVEFKNPFPSTTVTVSPTFTKEDEIKATDICLTVNPTYSVSGTFILSKENRRDASSANEDSDEEEEEMIVHSIDSAIDLMTSSESSESPVSRDEFQPPKSADSFSMKSILTNDVFKDEENDLQNTVPTTFELVDDSENSKTENLDSEAAIADPLSSAMDQDESLTEQEESDMEQDEDLDSTVPSTPSGSEEIRSSTPCPEVLSLLPVLTSSFPLLTPEEEREKEAKQLQWLQSNIITSKMD